MDIELIKSKFRESIGLRDALISKRFPGIQIISETQALQMHINDELHNIGDRYVAYHIMDTALTLVNGACITAIHHQDNYITWSHNSSWKAFTRLFSVLNRMDEQFDCEICMEKTVMMDHCNECGGGVCTACSNKMGACPYCRKPKLILKK